MPDSSEPWQKTRPAGRRGTKLSYAGPILAGSSAECGAATNRCVPRCPSSTSAQSQCLHAVEQREVSVDFVYYRGLVRLPVGASWQRQHFPMCRFFPARYRSNFLQRKKLWQKLRSRSTAYWPVEKNHMHLPTSRSGRPARPCRLLPSSHRPTSFSAAPLCSAMWSVLSLLISYCGSSSVA